MALFKKLSESLKVERLIKEEITKEEIKEIEQKIIFENFVNELPKKDADITEVK